ncbi:MAG: hypothetical protein PWP58_111 [Bacillota bacterium]|nr:hypothetical protein [Bacillota bacterium]
MVGFGWPFRPTPCEISLSISHTRSPVCLLEVYTTAGNMPDFTIIAAFRRRHLKAFKKLFLKVLKLCQKAGLVKLGHVALDSTKVKVNASKHKAMNYEGMKRKEDELKKEIEELIAVAEKANHAEEGTMSKR